MNETREFYELSPADVGKTTIRAFGRRWRVDEFIGRILPGDVGKRVYHVGPEMLQVENDEQVARRCGRIRLTPAQAAGFAPAEGIDPTVAGRNRGTLGAVTAAAVRVHVTRAALKGVRKHRDALREVGADAAADYLSRALKSIEGAERHAARLFNEAREAAGAADQVTR